MGKRHIMLEGSRHVGKTTLIQKLLAGTDVPLYGYFTKSVPSKEPGFHDIYIHPAGCPEADRVYTPQNQIGSCNTKIHRVNPEVFETVGVRLLQSARQDGIILMDELGFMEAGAPHFMEEVLRLLGEDTHVIGSIKPRTDIPFLEKIRHMPKVEVVQINEDNRDDLFAALQEEIASWTRN